MRVVLSYSHKDWNLAFELARVLFERTDVPRDKVVLYGSQHAPRPTKGISLGGVKYVRCEDDSATYPLGPNQMFAGIMAHAFRQGWHEPMFLIEGDGFPTCVDWYERVKGEHESLGVHVSGSKVDWVDPVHYNGNLVIHPDLVSMYPCLGRVVYQSWDCFHAETLIKHGGDNKEILNARRHMLYYPVKWWWEQKQKDGHRPAWVHGCQSFQMVEHIEREGF